MTCMARKSGKLRLELRCGSQPGLGPSFCPWVYEDHVYLQNAVGPLRHLMVRNTPSDLRTASEDGLLLKAREHSEAV